MRDPLRDYEAEVFEDVLKHVRLILEAEARKWRKQLGLTHDEALNEARFGLMLGLRSYDYNESHGGIYNYASKCVHTHFQKAWQRARAHKRNHHVEVPDEATGKKKVQLLKFARPEYLVGHRKEEEAPGPVQTDFMDLLEAPTPGSAVTSSATPPPDAELMAVDAEQTAERFRKALLKALSERDRKVLLCKLDPPKALKTRMMEELVEEPTIPLIGWHLGLSKNEVDWALRRIRDKALELIGREFSGLADQSIFRAYVERRQ